MFTKIPCVVLAAVKPQERLEELLDSQINADMPKETEMLLEKFSPGCMSQFKYFG